MAALDDIKEQFRERFSVIWDRVQESSIYNNLLERYQSLPPSAQRGMIATVAIGLVLFLLSIPYSFLDSAGQHMTEFEERRSLIRELLRTSRVGQGQHPLRSGPAISALKNQLDGIFKAALLVPDQIGTAQESDISETQNIVPKGISQVGISVNLKKLNIRQVTDIGFELSKMHPSVKLFSVDIAANKEMKNYYDVVYKIISFSFPFNDEGGGDSFDYDSDQGAGTGRSDGRSGGVGDEE